MSLSQHEIRKLGKRLRDGSRDATDMLALEQFRDSHDHLLLEYSLKASERLSGQVEFLATGRPKRTKSILRKLERPENVGMDLYRLGDLVGLRIIVHDIEVQNRCDELLSCALPVLRRIDYRDRQDGYRAIHYVLLDDNKRLEVQLRTLPQHLWAEESESFGEKVKEGGGTTEIRDYLCDLAKICHNMENNLETDFETSALYSIRNPIGAKLPVLVERFRNAIVDGQQASSYLMVFDSGTKELTQLYKFTDTERTEALKEFHRLSKQLPDDRYDVLVFNTCREDAVKVTHSRFF